MEADNGSELKSFDVSQVNEKKKLKLKFIDKYMGMQRVPHIITSIEPSYNVSSETASIYSSIKSVIAKNIVFSFSYKYEFQTFRYIDLTPEEITVNGKKVESGFYYAFVLKSQTSAGNDKYSPEWFKEKGFTSYPDPEDVIIKEHVKKLYPNKTAEDVVCYKLKSNTVLKAEWFKGVANQVAFLPSKEGADHIKATLCYNEVQRVLWGKPKTAKYIATIETFVGLQSLKNNKENFKKLRTAAMISKSL